MTRSASYECHECEEEYPAARAENGSLGDARFLCAHCADRRYSLRDVKREVSQCLVLEHKVGYRYVRTRADVLSITSGKPNGRI